MEQEHILNTHFDTLNEWYENAERITKTNLPNDGDTIIYPGPTDGSYVIESDTSGWNAQIVFSNEECRILHRAPKSTPAWHESFAVIAHTNNNGPQVWERCGGHWDGTAGDEAHTEDLRDVTPLIEAKVTREMVESAREEAKNRTGTFWELSLVSRMLTAALGLETK